MSALKLAEAGRSVVLIERGETAGSNNLSGGIFYCRVMEQAMPGFVEQAPVERRITRNTISFLNATSHVNIDYYDQRLAEPVNAVSVFRAKLDPWLAEQCEEAGVMVMPGVRVDSLLKEGEQVVGVRSGEDELRSHIVIAADGVNSFIARDASVRAMEPTKHLAVGVKSVFGQPRQVLEDRFHLTGDEGGGARDRRRRHAGRGRRWLSLHQHRFDLDRYRPAPGRPGRQGPHVVRRARPLPGEPGHRAVPQGRRTPRVRLPSQGAGCSWSSSASPAIPSGPCEEVLG